MDNTWGMHGIHSLLLGKTGSVGQRNFIYKRNYALSWKGKPASEAHIINYGSNLEKKAVCFLTLA